MVSAQQTHLEQRRVLSQDRVHANHRGHHAQRFSSFAAFSPAHAPNLSPAIQGPIGGGLPTVGCFHRGVGRATRNERQRAAPLAQGARPRRPPAWRPRPLLPSSRWRCARRRPALQAELRPLAPLAPLAHAFFARAVIVTQQTAHGCGGDDFASPKRLRLGLVLWVLT